MATKKLTFDENPFAEGRFRYAYKATWILPPSKVGQIAVVKKYKSTYTWEESDWNITKKNYSKAKSLAAAFNKDRRSDFSVEFANIDILTVLSMNSYVPVTAPKLGEFVAVEDYIPGQFTKWCNNYGYIEPQYPTMPAFMHWSWYHTNGQVMVADLQGVIDKNGYHLTDPAILSTTGEYGPTDTGIEGMAMFFLKHKCNDYCRGLPKPTMDDVKAMLPQYMLSQCSALQQLVRDATSYRNEIKLPPEIKKSLVGLFTEIAKRQEV